MGKQKPAKANKEEILAKALRLREVKLEGEKLAKEQAQLESDLLDYAASTEDYDLGTYKAYERESSAKLTGKEGKEKDMAVNALLGQLNEKYVKKSLDVTLMYENLGVDGLLESALSTNGLSLQKETKLHLKVVG